MSDTTQSLLSFSNQLADAVEAIGPALVVVNGRARQSASGIGIAPDVVLTADHVVERDDDLTVVNADGQELAAQIVGRDPATDLAVLRVSGLGTQVARAAEQLPRVGQVVLAVGRPSRGGPMASMGVISAVGGPVRTMRGGVINQLIQTDATPYPGFSGGALIDTSGAVLGLLTTGLIRGIPLGIPAQQAWQIGAALQQHGSLKRGYLGIGSQPVAIPAGQRTDGMPESGLLVVAVTSGSPADSGGLLVGDILVGFGGQPLRDTEDLQGLLAAHTVGTPVPLDVLRGGQAHQITITVGARP